MAVRRPNGASVRPDVDLDRVTIPGLQRRMDRADLTAVELADMYLDRVRSVDPRLRAVLLADPDALRHAAASDGRRRAGRLRGPLDGIPILLKDNIDTADLATTAGSRALCGPPPAEDAAIVRRLRDAGAVVIGKANLSEWANFRSARSVSGWSAVGGQTANPYVLERSPGGSSSGSAAAVAAALAQVAIGTETDGSIMSPAGMNGVVGVKPSLGSVSRTGIVPISADQDTAGPIARHVVDAALTLSVLWGRDPRDPVTLGTQDPGSLRDRAGDPGDALRGTRIGRWRIAAFGAPVEGVMEDAADALRAEGAQVEPVEPADQQRLAALRPPALLPEFRRDLEGYLRGRVEAPRTLAELVEYNRRDPAERSCFAGQELLEAASSAPATDDPAYRRARRELTTYARRAIDETLRDHRLDAIVVPTNAPAWRTGENENDLGVKRSNPAAAAGYPSITVPAGFVGALPVGVSFLVGRWADPLAVALAAAFERATGARRPPRYVAADNPGTIF